MLGLEHKRIAIIGLGYVGLPLAVEFGKKFSTIGFDIDFGNIAKAFNYVKVFRIEKLVDFEQVFMDFKNQSGPCLLEIVVNKGARKELGRPTVSPKENKLDFMSFIQK